MAQSGKLPFPSRLRFRRLQRLPDRVDFRRLERQPLDVLVVLAADDLLRVENPS
jgi:hypothetical protein